MILQFPRTPQQQIDAMRFECACCNSWHSGIMDLVKTLPDPIASLSEEDRTARAIMTPDLCSLDDEHFFVRSVLYLPIRETSASLGFGVWGSLAKANFQTYFAEFSNPDPGFGPFFSWLCSTLPPFDCHSLKSDMVFEPGNQRPRIQLHESGNPLFLAQRDGLTLEDLAHIYAAWGHTALIPPVTASHED